MEQTTSKNLSEINPQFFTHTYTPVLSGVLEGLRPQQIADKLGVKKQTLNYRLKRLKEAGLVEKGIRTSYREYTIPEAVQREVKALIGGLDTSPPAKTLNAHRLEVKYPILEDNDSRLKHTMKWKNNLITYQLEHHKGLFFMVKKTTKHIILSFPENFQIEIDGSVSLPLASFADSLIVDIVSPLAHSLLRSLGIKVGKPRVCAHYAFQDAVARKIVKDGIRILYKKGNDQYYMDASPHFNPRGELETNTADSAEQYMKMIASAPKILDAFAAVQRNSASAGWK